VVRLLSALVFAASVAAAAPLEAARHPIHSTLAEISFDAAAHVATVRVRAFADDFGTAIARWRRLHPRARGTPPDSISLDYLAHMVSLESAPSEFSKLEWCGVQQTGAVLWLCLRGHLDHGLEGVRVADRVLNDLFDDEINIVQIENAGRKTSAVFTRKDVAKVLIERAGR
jgi:hypothetical protein